MDAVYCLIVVLLLASFFRSSISVPVFIAPIKGPIYAAKGSNVKFSWDFTEGFTDIDFGLATQVGELQSTIMRVTKGTPLTLQYHPDYKGRVSWGGNADARPVEAMFILFNVSHSDTRKYACQVSKGITVVQSVDLIVTDANIVEHPKSAICQTEGGEVNFTCNATGTPHPNVTWVKNGDEIKSSSVKINRDGRGYSTLTIKNCGENDVARYRCKATNPPDLEIVSEAAALFFDFIANDTAEVDKNSSPSSVTGSIGEETTLRCAFTGYPSPSINWTLPNGDSTQTRLPFLVIKPKSSEQFGKYTCSAEGFTSRTMVLKGLDGAVTANVTTTNITGNVLAWGAVARAKFYTVYGTDEEYPYHVHYIGCAKPKQVNSVTFQWDSLDDVRENEKRLNLKFEVRAQTDTSNHVISRTRVTLDSKARSLQAGFLEIVVPLAVGLLSAGIQ